MIKNRNCDFSPAFELPVAASDPAAAKNLVEGMIYYNSVSDLIRKYDGAAWADIGGGAGGVTTFVALTDTPANFTGSGDKIVKVNTGETALEFVTLSGDISINAGGVAAIGSGVIINADIKSDAGIAVSKIALAEGSLMVGNASTVGVALDTKTDKYMLIGNGTTLTSVAISGDIAITNLGVVTVTDLTIASEAQGDILYFNNTNWVRLAAGVSGKYLKTQGAGSNPIWDTPSVGTADKLVSPFKVEGGTHDPETTVTAQTVGAAALTIPDLANVAQEWVFSKQAQTLENKTLTTPIIVTTGSIVDAGGDEYLKFVESAAPVNFVQITSGDTGAPGNVEIASEGDDADIDLLLVAKGTGIVKADGVEVVTLTGTQVLTNKTLTTPTITSIISTNTHAVPAGSGADEFCLIAATQALTNKTLTSAVLTTPSFVDTGYIADSNGNELIMFGVTGAATTYLKVTNNINSAGVTVEVAGGAAAEDLLLVAKGAGVVKAGGVEVVTLSGTQVLTNKTLTTPTLTTPTLNGRIIAYAAKSGAYTATATDEILACNAGAAPFTILLPTAVGIAGTVYTVKKVDAGGNAVTIDGAGGETIDGAATVALSAQWNYRTMVSDGANWLVVSAG